MVNKASIKALKNQNGGTATKNDVDPFTTSIKLEQTILDYGRDLTLEKNLISLNLAKAQLVKKNRTYYMMQLMHLQI